jgi:hypothetical protein
VLRGGELSESMKTYILKITEKFNHRKTILDKVAEADIQITQSILKRYLHSAKYARERIRKKPKRVNLWR